MSQDPETSPIPKTYLTTPIGVWKGGGNSTYNAACTKAFQRELVFECCGDRRSFRSQHSSVWLKKRVVRHV